MPLLHTRARWRRGLDPSTDNTHPPPPTNTTYLRNATIPGLRRADGPLQEERPVS